MEDAGNWCPVELMAFCYEEELADGTTERFKLEPQRTRWLWIDWKSDTEMTPSRIREAAYNAGHMVLLSLRDDDSFEWREVAEGLPGNTGFERYVQAWLEQQPSVSRGLEQDDPVLLLWHPGNNGSGASTLKQLLTDLSAAELALLVREDAWTPAELPRAAAVLPREAAVRLNNFWGLRGEVVDLVPMVLATPEEAEVALALWEPSSEAPEGSFTHVRAMARAL